MITELILKLENKEDLSYNEMSDVMSDILSGSTNDQQNIDLSFHV